MLFVPHNDPEVWCHSCQNPRKVFLEIQMRPPWNARVYMGRQGDQKLILINEFWKSWISLSNFKTYIVRVSKALFFYRSVKNSNGTLCIHMRTLNRCGRNWVSCPSVLKHHRWAQLQRSPLWATETALGPWTHPLRPYAFKNTSSDPSPASCLDHLDVPWICTSIPDIWDQPGNLVAIIMHSKCVSADNIIGVWLWSNNFNCQQFLGSSHWSSLLHYGNWWVFDNLEDTNPRYSEDSDIEGHLDCPSNYMNR